MMKTAFITNYWKNSDGGGIKTYLVNLVDALKNKGADVSVIFREGDDSLISPKLTILATRLLSWPVGDAKIIDHTRQLDQTDGFDYLIEASATNGAMRPSLLGSYTGKIDWLYLKAKIKLWGSVLGYQPISGTTYDYLYLFGGPRANVLVLLLLK